MAAVTQQLLAAGGGSWQTAFSIAIGANATGQTFQTETLRCLIPQASLLITGGSLIRITTVPHGTNTITISDCYIGQASAGYTSSAPAFAGTPTQVLKSASVGWSLTGGGSNVVSDAVSLAIPSSNGLAIAFKLGSGAGSNIPSSAASNAQNWSYKAGNDVSTVAASGYTTEADNKGICLVSLVEVFK